MVGKIIMASLMLLGVVKPEWLIKITEFWKLDQNGPSPTMLILTRVISAIALVIILFLP